MKLRRATTAVLALALATLSAAGQERPKSVLVLLTDDQRADTIAALGNDRIRTPNLDRLVEQGFSFTRAYCMGSSGPAVCAPSRAMLLSGRSLFHLDRDVYEASDPEPILPEHLRDLFERIHGATQHVGRAPGLDSGDLKRMRRRNQLQKDLEAAIRKGCLADRNKRYASSAAFLDALLTLG